MEPPLLNPHLVQFAVRTFEQSLLHNPTVAVGEHPLVFGLVLVVVHRQIGDGEEIIIPTEVKADKDVPTVLVLAIGDASLYLSGKYLIARQPLRHSQTAIHIKQLTHALRELLLAVLTGFCHLAVVEVVLHNDTEHGVDFPAQGVRGDDVFLVRLLILIWLQQQAHLRVVHQAWLGLARLVLELFEQQIMSALQHLNERAAGDGAGGGRAEGERLTPHTH